MSLPYAIVSCVLLVCGSPLSAGSLLLEQSVEQPPEVIEAYRVCQTFERIMGQDLNFDKAFEATFIASKVRRRAIAIAAGEFGDLDFAKIDDESLIKAYKLRTQLFYLMLPLAGPSAKEEPVFFPPEIKSILERKAPTDARQFTAYVSQLERDVNRFRAHLDRLAAGDPAVAERITKFKSEALATRIEPPLFRIVEPIPDQKKDGVGISPVTYHYEINNYLVAKEQGKMRIVGIRFFSRLF